MYKTDVLFESSPRMSLELGEIPEAGRSTQKPLNTQGILAHLCGFCGFCVDSRVGYFFLPALRDDFFALVFFALVFFALVFFALFFLDFLAGAGFFFFAPADFFFALLPAFFAGLAARFGAPDDLRDPPDLRALAPPLALWPSSASPPISGSEPPMPIYGMADPPVSSSSGIPIPPSKSSCMMRLPI